MCLSFYLFKCVCLPICLSTYLSICRLMRGGDMGPMMAMMSMMGGAGGLGGGGLGGMMGNPFLMYNLMNNM